LVSKTRLDSHLVLGSEVRDGLLAEPALRQALRSVTWDNVI